MSSYSDQTSAEVAEEAESERAGLVSTLDQLRENLRPENMVDEMLSQAQVNSSDLADKFWKVVRANPIPSAIIGLGAAMLVSSSQRLKRKSSTSERAWSAYADPFDPAGSRQSDESISSSGTAWPTGSYEPTGGTMDAYAFHTPRTGLARLLDEQPLILAALGVAVGAAVGSAIRSTEIEGQWMGDASDSVRRNASAIAREQLSHLRATASQTLDQMKATAAEHGVSAENVSGLVHDLGDDVRTTAFSAKHAPDNTLQH